MQPHQQLINRFYQGKCTPEKAQQVMNWLLQNETEPSLAKDWLEASPTGEYPGHYEAEMLEHIQQAIHRKTPVRRMRHTGWAVAAGIFLIAGLLVFGWLHPVKKSAMAVQRSSVITKESVLAWNAPENRPLTIRMVDGSTVILEPRSVLQYNAATYNQKDRVLWLKGKAVFFVAPNKNRPFSVNANGYSTTALGTSFLVDAKRAGDIHVKLFTGKVVIRHLDNAQPPVKDVYLAPGEEMVLNDTAQQPVVNRWLPEVLPVKESKETMIARSKTVQRVGDTLVFDNAPLVTVLDVLQRRYHVNIRYDRHHVADAYFTGSVLPGDAIELILKTVTRINGLNLIAAGDGFVIK